MSTHPRVQMAGVVIDLMDQNQAVETITEQCTSSSGTAEPLAVISANLDHIIQFGTGSRWDSVLGHSLSPSTILRCTDDAEARTKLRWLTLLDGAPLVAQAQKVTGRSWPRLAGSDLIGPILDAAQREGLTVGFLGGSEQVQHKLAQALPGQRPRLKITGFWSPNRSELEDHEASIQLAEQIRATNTDILVVGLGKPRQELWMASYADLTGARVLLAFGAVVDFLAGTVQRAPHWVSSNGLEWAWRLGLEPRRLAQRYLLDDPPGLVKIRQAKQVFPPAVPASAKLTRVVEGIPSPSFSPGRFVSSGNVASVTVIAVTYNNADSVEELITCLRAEAQDLALRVVISDNGSTDETLRKLRGHKDVVLFSNEANLGYAGGINVARTEIGECEAVLVLNPDLSVQAGAISTLLCRMRQNSAGIVVPRLLDSQERTYQSLRREPSLLRALGDALCGEKLTARPQWSSEIEFDPESYSYPHPVQWATGAALLVRSDVAKQLGAWDEQFFLYSEETDYFRRARQAGYGIWYEPRAVMTHEMGGSGSSVALNTLMAVNRVRYARKHQSVKYAQAFHTVVALHHALRANLPAHHGIFPTLLNESSWAALPGGTQPINGGGNFPSGTVIIPAHNESAVIARTLAPLAPLAKLGVIEVIVACNGCTDDTAGIARSFEGIRVVESQIPSKVAAMNLADSIATHYPRLYLDADIQISVSALRLTFEYLSVPGALSARPAFEYDLANASWPVRAFYRARRRIPMTNQALWGAGAYGLSREGRQRFKGFPAVTADDLFIDQLFSQFEKQVIPTIPVKVITPQNLQSLRAILRRNYRGQHELAGASPTRSSSVRSFGQLLSSISGPRSALDALVYTALVTTARSGKRGKAVMRNVWERDDSSRSSKLAA